ncbi:hypothetical protein JJC00_32455 [Bradyrhizobium diazoefficiens]|uniref:hypothetical protein n=1 Tax=Bradyrhizobium diazoefficiens TaxID=1355477 RepID=UPI00190B82D5|nr:hypothetical protein [Bradyrhizobium diazoefficiens]QQO33195.1 hypothetical protein JJC00_32455 [Bradyrhizobium diazoefficiens]
MRQLFACGLALHDGSLRRELLFGVRDCGLHLRKRVGIAVSRQRAGGDGCLQLCARLIIRIEFGFEVVTLQLELGVRERRLGGGAAVVQSTGAHGASPVRLEVFHGRLLSKEWFHAFEATKRKGICEGSTCGGRHMVLR